MCLQAVEIPSTTFSVMSGVELAGGEVIHEEHGSCALHGNVVDAMVDQVGAHGGVDVHVEGDLQLGADAVHAGDENRVEELLLIDGEEAAEAANLAEYSLGESLVGEILDALLGAVAAFNIHARVGVGDRSLGGFVGQRINPPVRLSGKSGGYFVSRRNASRVIVACEGSRFGGAPRLSVLRKCAGRVPKPPWDKILSSP